MSKSDLDTSICFYLYFYYRKTPLISTYVISGLAMVQVLTFGGYDKAEAKILQGRSLFNLVLSADNALLCMFQRLWTYLEDIGVLIFGGYVLSGHCGRQQISVKNEGVLIFGGVLIYGVLRYISIYIIYRYLYLSTDSAQFFFTECLACWSFTVLLLKESWRCKFTGTNIFEKEK